MILSCGVVDFEKHFPVAFNIVCFDKFSASKSENCQIRIGTLGRMYKVNRITCLAIPFLYIYSNITTWILSE